ncbi:MAG: AgmX/PglI C-terminal domain-containing protein [Deltaproteobacteria bacterium]|nr:MAG: AgmX/PglI C-terminal domain-containing protein [Deltaproteobacteria bacterium]
MKIITILLFLFSCGSVTKRDSSGKVTQKKKKEEVIVASLNGSLIRQIIVKNLPQIRTCYQNQMSSSGKTYQGMVTMKFTIEESGLVDRAKVETNDPSFPRPIGECVSTVLKRIKFPRSKGGVVEVSQPFNFHPTKS